MATKNEAEAFAQTVAAQVRAEIGARDSSVAAIARETGINRETLDRWVKGDRQFNVANLFRVAAALGMNTHLLVKRAEERFVEQNAASKLAQTEAEIIVGGFVKNVDLHDIDLSGLRLAASTDNSAVLDQTQPDYENESQDPEY